MKHQYMVDTIADTIRGMGECLFGLVSQQEYTSSKYFLSEAVNHCREAVLCIQRAGECHAEAVKDAKYVQKQEKQ